MKSVVSFSNSVTRNDTRADPPHIQPDRGTDRESVMVGRVADRGAADRGAADRGAADRIEKQVPAAGSSPPKREMLATELRNTLTRAELDTSPKSRSLDSTMLCS